MIDNTIFPPRSMPAFSFSRQDIWHRHFKIWRRKYSRCIGRPHLTLVLMFVAVLLYRMENDNSSSYVNDPTRSNYARQADTNLRITKPSPVIHSSTIPKAAIVLLAPPRKASSQWNIDRFCFLRRVVRSIDQHLNAHHGPYPIVIILAKDYHQDPTHQDGPYTTKDRELIEQWAPHSQIEWHEIDMYSNTALEPGVSLEQILAWRRGEDGGQEGRPLGYQSMCRLWSGQMQNMPHLLLDRFDVYMRLDDDSLLVSDLEFDPFRKFVERNLTYVYRRAAIDFWGIQELWRVAKPQVLDPELLTTNNATRLKFLEQTETEEEWKDHYEYRGMQPYNNFHISRVDFWTSPLWNTMMNQMDNNHLFYKHRVGDANVHAIALLMIGDRYIEEWDDFPYVHNSNDMGGDWGVKEWKEECDSVG